jgi:hypothetical protein
MSSSKESVIASSISALDLAQDLYLETVSYIEANKDDPLILYMVATAIALLVRRLNMPGSAFAELTVGNIASITDLKL